MYDPADAKLQLRHLTGDDSFDSALLGDNGTLERARHYRKMCEDPHGGALLAAVGTPGMIHAVEAVSAAAPNFSEASGIVLRAIALSRPSSASGTFLSSPGRSGIVCIGGRLRWRRSSSGTSLKGEKTTSAQIVGRLMHAMKTMNCSDRLFG